MTTLDGMPPTPLEHADPPHILVVDDEGPIRDVLRSFLGSRKYQVTTVGSASEALEILKHLDVDLIVMDVFLGDEDGVELTTRLKRSHPNQPVIVVSGKGDDQNLRHEALDHGASDYISKTEPLEGLHHSIQRTLSIVSQTPRVSAPPRRRVGLVYTAPDSVKALRPQSKHAHTSQSDAGSDKDHPNPSRSAIVGGEMNSAHAEGTGTSAESPHEPCTPQCLIPADPTAVAALAAVTADGSRMAAPVEVFLRLLAAYDANLGNTAMRAVVLCKTVAELLNLTREDRQNLLWAAALQDIGLIRVELGLIHRWQRDPDNCSKVELALAKRHPEFSQQIIESYPAFEEAGEIILAHHENWNGSGFPRGLRMEMIPWLARFLSAVTFYCSKHAPGLRTLAEMKTMTGQEFDPEAVEALASATAGTGLPKGARALMASELKPGMIAAEDVVDAENTIIIEAGGELNLGTLGRIVHLMRTAQIGSRVLVVS
jgi:response regulator RpfG family c-di-GMP phosphodiesterase